MNHSNISKPPKLLAYFVSDSQSSSFSEQNFEMTQWLKELKNESEVVIKDIYVDKSKSSVYRSFQNLNKLIADLDFADGVIISDLALITNTRIAVSLLLTLKKNRKSLYIVKTKQIIQPKPSQSKFFEILADLVLEIEQRKSNNKSHGLKNSDSKIGRPRKQIDWAEYTRLSAENFSFPKIAEKLGVSTMTLYNRLKKKNGGDLS